MVPAMAVPWIMTMQHVLPLQGTSGKDMKVMIQAVEVVEVVELMQAVEAVLQSALLRPTATTSVNFHGVQVFEHSPWTALLPLAGQH